jgi:hypothetical protein
MLAQSMLTELDSEISAFNELDEPDTFQQFFNREYKG